MAFSMLKHHILIPSLFQAAVMGGWSSLLAAFMCLLRWFFKFTLLLPMEFLKNHLLIFFSGILSIFKFFSPESNYVFVEAIQHALKNIFVSLHETCSLHTDDGPGIVALFLLFFSVSFLVHGFLLTMS